MSYTYFITNIEQCDNFTFAITWNDGMRSLHRLSELQKRCPCARCLKNNHSEVVKEDVKAIRVVSVGRYALRVAFTSGCSAGVYSYDLLRSFIKNSESTSLTSAITHE